MAHNAEEWRRLRSEFIEAAVKYEEYETFIERTAHSEEWYYNSGRYFPVGLIRWPYKPWRKCWILAPDSATNEEPFSTMKTLFGKAWLWLPRVITEEVLDTAETHLSEPPSPPDDWGLYWAKSDYQYWCWLLWFHWLRQWREANPTEAEKPSQKMVLAPFHCSADLIAQWGLDGSDGTFPAWLSLPTAPDPESQPSDEAGLRAIRATTTHAKKSRRELDELAGQVGQTDPAIKVDAFLRALDSIEAEIREAPDVVFVEMSLTRGRMSGDTGDTFDENGRYIMLLTSRSIRAHWDSLCFDIGGSAFPFVWSPKRSAVYESFPQDLANETESVEFAVWYYLDSWRSPIPQHLLDRFPPDEDCPDPGDCLAAMAYQAEMDRVVNVMRAVKTAWSRAPEAVIREFGDLSKMPMGPTAVGNDCFDLWWPAALLALAVRGGDVVLTVKACEHLPWSLFDDLPEGGDHEARIDAFDPTTWTVSLSSPSLLTATSCALRAFRRVAEDSIRKPSTLTAGAGQPVAAAAPAVTPTGAKFKWTPPLLEGYVRVLLREVEDPTERKAVEWIAAKSRKDEPARATLRKTYYWRNRPQKTPKPRTTNEAQSGVSPAQNANAAVSHEEVTNAVLDIEEKLQRQLVDNERDAVAWTLGQAGPNEEQQDEAIRELIQGFRSGDM